MTVKLKLFSRAMIVLNYVPPPLNIANKASEIISKCLNNHKMPQKLTTTACFIQEESSGGKPPEDSS